MTAPEILRLIEYRDNLKSFLHAGTCEKYVGETKHVHPITARDKIRIIVEIDRVALRIASAVAQ
jgi:hypothetical protein